jgi:choline dehydrogenase
MSINNHSSGPGAAQFLERARTNQARLVGALQPHYDFVVGGAGSSGSVVARRLADNPDVSVLLVEAGEMTTCQA